MIIEFSVLDTQIFSLEHLNDSPENEKLISEFKVGNAADGLENYLKNTALKDEENNFCRTYLVKDKTTGEVACYFSLRTGLITMQVYKEAFDSIPAIELSNFAVNEAYRTNHPEVKGIGAYTFKYFILPIARCLAKYIGISSLYIYALPEEKLINHYKKLGFVRLPPKLEKFIQHHVKPKYDEGCIFMVQTL